MKRSLVIVAMLASGLILRAAAQTPAAPKPAPVLVPMAKVAVIDFQAAVGQTSEFQRDLADLQKKYGPQRAHLKSLSDEIDNLTKQLQAQGTSLSEVERNSRAKVIDEKKKQLDRDTQDAQQDFQAEMQDIYSGLAAKAYDVLADYAHQQGFTLVLDVTQESKQPPSVLYAVESTNITKPIIDAYNLKSGVPAPVPPPAH